MVCTHDGRRAYIGCNDGTIRVWDLERGEELAQWRDHRNCVLSMDLSPDETKLASAGEDSIIRIWDVASGQVIARAAGHTHATPSVAFAASGLWIASTGYDGAVRAWDPKTGNKLLDIPAQSERGAALAIAPNMKYIVSGGASNKMHIYDVIQKQSEGLIVTGHEPVKKGQSAHNMTYLQFLPGGSKLLSRGMDGTLQVWDFDKRAVIKKFTDANSWAFCASNDGTRVAYTSNNRVKIVSLTP